MFFNNKLICFSFIHKGGAMFITQQCDGDYNVQFLEWAGDMAETIGLDEEGGAMMYYTIIGYCSFNWNFPTI